MSENKLAKTFMAKCVKNIADSSAGWPAPVYATAQINEFIPEICKVPYDYLFRDDAVAMAECTLLVWEYLGFDLCYGVHDYYNFEPSNIGAKITYYKDHIADIDRSEFLINDENDLDKIKYQGIDAGKMRYLIDYAHAFQKYVGMAFYPVLNAPWNLAGNLYGIENLVISALTEPEFVHELLNRIVYDLQAPLLRDLIDNVEGIGAICLADAYASPPLVTLDILKEFDLPYVKKLVEAVDRKHVAITSGGFWGIRSYKGDMRKEFMDYIIDCWGGGTVAALDPDLEDVGIKMVREYADEKNVAFFMGLSNKILLEGTKEQIVERVKKYMLEGKNGKTPLSFQFNNIDPYTPVENVITAVQALRIYGAPEATEETPYVEPEAKESFEDFLKNKLQNNPEGYTFDWLEKSGYSYLKK